MQAIAFRSYPAQHAPPARFNTRARQLTSPAAAPSAAINSSATSPCRPLSRSGPLAVLRPSRGGGGLRVHISRDWLAMPSVGMPWQMAVGERFKLESLRLTASHRIPGNVKPNDPAVKKITRADSGAIMIYLSEKTGGRLT